jgi:phosphonate transport system substrate-binding protein
MKPIGNIWALMLLVSVCSIEVGPLSAGPLTVSTIGTEPASEIKKFHLFTSYLAKLLHSEGITEGQVVVARNISEMAALIKQGKADLYIDSAFPTMAVNRLSGSKPMLRRWKKELAEYHSVIFAKSGSAIHDLGDLKGKTISFEEPFSSSGYLLPKLAMVQKGLKLTVKNNPTDAVRADEVGYVFGKDDENTMMWVERGMVAAGATDHQSFVQEARGNLSNLRVLHRTFALPRQLVSSRADLAPRLVAKIREALIQMNQSAEGRKVLLNFERTSKFDEIPEQSMEPLVKAVKFIDAEIKSQ